MGKKINVRIEYLEQRTKIYRADENITAIEFINVGDGNADSIVINDSLVLSVASQNKTHRYKFDAGEGNTFDCDFSVRPVTDFNTQKLKCQVIIYTL